MAASITLGALPPEDSVAAFRARGLLRPSFRWQEVWQAEHARAFAVAGVMRLDVLRTIRDHVDGAVRNGTGFDEFNQALRRQLVAKGWWGNIEITDPATGEVRTTRFNEQRLQLIFDVNMRQSHAAGRWARIERSKARLPYVMYRTMRDEKVRASHRAWDGVVLPVAHPFWTTHYPPNGWRCRCTAFALSERDVQRLRDAGQVVRTEPPPTQWVEFENRSTGQVERVPRGIDPGFAYNPGQVHVPQATDRLAAELGAVRPTAPGAGNALQMARATIARGRSEPAFRAFLAEPPPGPGIALPVAAVPAPRGLPTVASVLASDLRRQAARADYPRTLPVKPAGWAMAQAVIDRGAQLELPDGRVLWWWARGSGAQRRVHVLELERGTTMWVVQQLAALSVDEALGKYPALRGLV